MQVLQSNGTCTKLRLWAPGAGDETKYPMEACDIKNSVSLLAYTARGVLHSRKMQARSISLG